VGRATARSEEGPAGAALNRTATVKSRIVIVEDDPMSAKVVRFALEDEGFDAVVAARGSQGLDEIVGRETDLVILDIVLPDLTGLALCRELRARRYMGPIIFLSGRRELAAKIEAFAAGADDFVVKPFEVLELVARVRSNIRRTQRAEQQTIGTVVRAGDAELLLASLTYSSDVIEPTLLTPTEMRMLEYLMRHGDTAVSRETLINHVWGFDSLDDTNRVDVYIRRLRHKIEPDPTAPRYLHTVRGLGYVFRPADDPSRPASVEPNDADLPPSGANPSGIA
jgi:DNA-binding response OmpR family regulator